MPTSQARTIVLTAKGIQAVAEMRAHNAVPVIPEDGWPRKQSTRRRTKAEAKATNEGERKLATWNAQTQGRDLFLSPAQIRKGDRLLRIVGDERKLLGTVERVEKINESYRFHFTEGNWKTAGPTGAILVEPRGINDDK